MDQAQHFTGTASAAARSSGDEVGAEFRSGLDAAERECECVALSVVTRELKPPAHTYTVFILAQESSRQVKAWYESSDRIR